MDEVDVQSILLVRAFEEEDREGRLLPRERRAEATRLAREQAGGGDDMLLVRRATLLGADLTDALPTLPRLLQVARLRFAPAPAIVVAALAAGLLSNALGPHRAINLLSLPLLGLLTWNALVYLLLFLSALGLLSAARGLAEWLADGILDRLRRWMPPGDATGAEARLASAAAARFVGLWRRQAARLLAARLRRALHLGAAAFAVGVIGGMYFRGLAFEYRATWESTFLGTVAVQRLLDGLLAPAAWLLGVEVPDVGPLRGPAGGGNAAPWIHLWATTVAIVVLAPRGLLAALLGWRARRLTEHLPLGLDAGYFRRILAGRSETAGRVEIYPYSFEPERAAADFLKSTLLDLFGAQADVRMRSPLAYGEESPAAVPSQTEPGGARDCVVVLFNLAQSPEAEVHGAFLERLKASVGRSARLLVLIDEENYRRRVTDPDRRVERARAWTRVVDAVGLSAVLIDRSEAGLIEGVLDAMAAALWPAVERVRA